MKRNMDLIRDILLELETRHDIPTNQLHIENENNKDEIGYHVQLMCDAGFIDANLDMTFGTSYTIGYVIKKINNKGHEFLDASRNEGIWKKFKTQYRDKILSAPLEIITTLLIEYTKNALL